MDSQFKHDTASTSQEYGTKTCLAILRRDHMQKKMAVWGATCLWNQSISKGLSVYLSCNHIFWVVWRPDDGSDGGSDWLKNHRAMLLWRIVCTSTPMIRFVVSFYCIYGILIFDIVHGTTALLDVLPHPTKLFFTVVFFSEK